MKKTSFSPNKCVRANEIEAYLAGIIASDGHLRKDSYEIEISSSNIEFARRIQKMLETLTKNKIRIYHGKTAFIISVNEKNLQEFFEQKYSIPRGRKSMIIEGPKFTNTEEIKNYIRGYFDGDSSVHRRKMRNKYIPRIRVMSTTKRILEWIKKHLILFDINTSNIFIDKAHGFGRRICYRLELYGSAVEKYKEKIGYSHPEKNKKLSELVKLLK